MRSSIIKGSRDEIRLQSKYEENSKIIIELQGHISGLSTTINRVSKVLDHTLKHRNNPNVIEANRSDIENGIKDIKTKVQQLETYKLNFLPLIQVDFNKPIMNGDINKLKEAAIYNTDVTVNKDRVLDKRGTPEFSELDNIGEQPKTDRIIEKRPIKPPKKKPNITSSQKPVHPPLPKQGEPAEWKPKDPDKLRKKIEKEHKRIEANKKKTKKKTPKKQGGFDNFKGINDDTIE